jgi:DNA invertase Pin-like site-specific DNA recombinase
MANQTSDVAGRGPMRLRCAIYTRKSSEEGLEQNFNSLDAQREACEAYIASQKHEGWNILPEMYDDGGYSGGTIERPAFQRLLVDVGEGKIDVVVVYKVDRLTRSLSDFAKIVEIFDKRNVSFVSVTQQFNTTTSMGRLTLNILLSFAQFEREVTGERIRDKFAASKKKGMWMGGLPSLGYDTKDKRLVINEAEAKTVRYIFRRYIELKSVRLLKADLDTRGIVSKSRNASDGTRYGEKPLARGALYLMLQNRIYRGETVHKDKSYPGEHEAIVDEALWSEVQSILTENRTDRILGTADKQVSLLSGILFDARGERMSPTHATKNNTRYRYYVSRPLLAGSAKDSGQRISASNLEALVTGRIFNWLSDRAAMLDIIQSHASDATTQKRLMVGLEQCVATWLELKADEVRNFVLSIVARIQVHADRIDILLKPVSLVRWLGQTDSHAEPTSATRCETEGSFATLSISIAARLKRVGKEMKILIEDGSDSASPDASLVRVLVRAHMIRDRFLADKSLTLDEIAKSVDIVPSYVTRLFRLTLLAPDIVSAILGGKHPPELNARKLLDDTRLPLDWNEQRRSLGFA